MPLPACSVLMSPEDQFSPAIPSREIAHRQTKQCAKLWEAGAEWLTMDLLRAAGWSSEGLRCWVEGDFLVETSRCRRWRGGKGFPAKVSFSFCSRAASTCQPALLLTFNHCWPAFLTAPGQEKEGIGSAGNQDHGCSGGAAWRLAR